MPNGQCFNRFFETVFQLHYRFADLRNQHDRERKKGEQKNNDPKPKEKKIKKRKSLPKESAILEAKDNEEEIKTKKLQM